MLKTISNNNLLQSLYPPLNLSLRWRTNHAYTSMTMHLNGFKSFANNFPKSSLESSSACGWVCVFVWHQHLPVIPSNNFSSFYSFLLSKQLSLCTSIVFVFVFVFVFVMWNPVVVRLCTCMWKSWETEVGVCGGKVVRGLKETEITWRWGGWQRRYRDINQTHGEIEKNRNTSCI